MLEINSLKVFHGPIQAVHDIDIIVSEGQCVTLLGPNGAGKTSTLSAITGTARSTGSIRLAGEQIARMSVEDRCRRGLAISPEGRRVFANLSVRDNLMMGGALCNSKAQLNAKIEQWFVQFPTLRERSDQLAGTLSGGEQQMLALARATLGSPKLLVVDEPTEGLAPQLVKQVSQFLIALKHQGVGVLLMEQKLQMALTISDRIAVMAGGAMVFDDSRQAFMRAESQHAAWLAL